MGRAGPEVNSKKIPQPTDKKELNNVTRFKPKYKAVHDPVHNTVFCSELQQLIDHWDSFPRHIKAAIKALIQTHITEVK